MIYLYWLELIIRLITWYYQFINVSVPVVAGGDALSIYFTEECQTANGTCTLHPQN